MRKFIREPLLHFIVLGALLFIGHGIWARHVAKTDYTIRIDPAEIQRQSQIFATENNRPATDADIEGLLFAHVEEQVLMREARRLGLDDEDTIIRRRLAQKMRFMISDIGAPAMPNAAKLREYFEANITDFVQAEQRSFRHVYFSPSARETIEADAAAVRETLSDDNWSRLGDPFMLSREMKARTQYDVTRDYGRDFAASIFTLPEGEWSAPVESALGLHLVKIDTITPALTPTFDQARAQVEAHWTDQAATAANTERLEDLMKKYKVVVDE